MVAANIKVFFRVRPSARPSKAVSLKQDDGLIEFVQEKNAQEGTVNNSKTHHKFRFDGILPMKISQEEVFSLVAKPVIEDVLQGINGTIFAYGQTGSGKTFTITGGAERYEDRGLIPRTIAYLFEEFKNRRDATYRMFISYLEIYNNDGYDLLSREEHTAKLEDLPKVQLREDEDGNIHFRNLSVNMAQKEEDALNLLFLGDTNRVVAETPMNDVSTRSHCMFIMWVESTQANSDTVRRAKLHLVDLAGSERISKSGVEGDLQKEARYINLSLHYLEQVIVALHERSSGARQHVPYRNSMMTSVLRDSLGGNCKTVMVGTAAIEDRHLEESISTCRFAQRVAAIKNNATVNEELDPALLIRRLKKEVAELKDELTLLNGDENAETLTDEDQKELRNLVQGYVVQQDPEAQFVCGSLTRFQECFRMLREVYWDSQGSSSGSERQPANLGGETRKGKLSNLEMTLHQLRQEVALRDHEISMLVGSLSKRNTKAAKEAAHAGPVFIQAPQGAPSEPGSRNPQAAQSAPSEPRQSPGSTPPDAATLLLDRNKAFDAFRKSVRRSETLDEGREAMKKLLAEAKELGEQANASRNVVHAIQKKIEKEMLGRVMGSAPHDPSTKENTLPPESPEVAALNRESEENIALYKKCTERLKVVKAEIDRYKAASQENNGRLQRDFEAWYLALQAQRDAGGQAPGSEPGGGGPPQTPVQESHERDGRSQAYAAPALASPVQPVPQGQAAATPNPSPSPVPGTAAPASSQQSAAPALTGHQQTDDDIRAYFEAVASLQSK